MKKLFIWAIATMLSAGAMAIPAHRGTRTVRNSDGTVLTISLRGDETFHYHVTSDGTPVRQNAAGDWIADTRDVVNLWSKASERRNAHRHTLARHNQRILKAPRRADATAVDAKKRGLLILVNFADKKFTNTDENCQAIYQQMLNGLGNPYGKNYGSVREYFRAQSYGQFDIEFDIAGPVNLSGNMSVYGGNDSNGEDIAPGKMVAEAIAQVDDDINFKDYDWDGDGEVENIYVIYAGFGEAYEGADPNTIWPHQWQLSDRSNYGKAVKTDGVTIDTYACGPELMGISGKTLDGIGTMCHEYSHCLGLPDFYDTNQKNFGMDEWSIMDYGCYNGDGFSPAGYTAYERWFSGWLEPVELKEGANIIDMPCIEENPVAYVVYNDQNHNEYYLLENHQKVGWDKVASGHGLLVVHVDYDQNAWYNNTVNNTATRQRMTIIAADNKLTDTTIAGDTYPNGGKYKALTDDTTPAATLYRANTDGVKKMHKPIEDITEASGLISFTFMGGAVSLQTPEPVTDESMMAITSTSFLAQWGEVDGAASYNLRWTEQEEESGEDPADDIMLYENFAKLYAENDGTQDISASLDQYMSNTGWTGQCVYKGKYGAKLATGKKPGSLTTPLLKGGSGTMTLLIDCSYYNNDSSTPTLSFIDVNGDVINSFQFDPDDEYILWYDFDEGVPDELKISISTTAGKRVYVGGLFAFDALLTEDEVNAFLEEAYGGSGAPKRVKKQHLSLAPRHAPVSNLVSGIIPANYTLTNLTPGKTYTWQVQAVGAEGEVSAWSPIVTVKLPLDDSVDSLRGLTTSTIAPIVDLAGRSIDARRPLRRGIYVVGGKKVVVR
ncbi:MAG: M6 family metalloprotease domain-containing protein [Bacteroidaceae bacterium]|nr:M6 family metalloprotease domain-containing protein [Bacteroidaceae bacterium]